MCTPDYHPSSPARFKSSKTVKVKKFPLLKDVNKPPLFRRGHSATTARVFWPPATRRTSPFQNIPLFNPYQPFNFTCPIHFLLTHVQRLYFHGCPFILQSALNNPAHTTDFHESGYFEKDPKICPENSSFIKIWQEWRVLYMKTTIHFLSYLTQFF